MLAATCAHDIHGWQVLRLADMHQQLPNLCAHSVSAAAHKHCCAQQRGRANNARSGPGTHVFLQAWHGLDFDLVVVVVIRRLWRDRFASRQQQACLLEVPLWHHFLGRGDRERHPFAQFLQPEKRARPSVSDEAGRRWREGGGGGSGQHGGNGMARCSATAGSTPLRLSARGPHAAEFGGEQRREELTGQRLTRLLNESSSFGSSGASQTSCISYWKLPMSSFLVAAL